MAYREQDRGDFVFDITEHIGVLKAYSNGWTKELNLVAWNTNSPKYDIRDWDEGHLHMSKGITLHQEEMAKLCDLMRSREAPVATAVG